MKQILGAFRRTSFGTVAALFLLTVVGVALPPREASAAGLLYRSLQLTSTQPSGEDLTGAGGDPAPEGSAANGDRVGHLYTFQVKTGTQLGGIKIQYCALPFDYLDFDDGTGSCANVSGFSSTNAGTATVRTYTSQANYNSNTVAATSTFTRDGTNSTINELIIGNGTPMVIGNNYFVTVEFVASSTNYFSNPDALGTFFAHVETYGTQTNAATTETPLDEGTVTSSTTNTIAINTRVQETLNFSVEGEDDPTGAPGPSAPEVGLTQCDPLGANGVIDIGDPANSNSLSASRTYDGFSYFRLATNSSKGAKVLYAGETLKSSAGDTIDPLTTTRETATPGDEEFGLALAIGNAANDVIAAASASNELFADTPYAIGANTFTGNVADGEYAFDANSNTAPELLASSVGVVRCDTGVVRYIANISNDTPAGIYSTKLSYIAVPSY